MASQPFRDECNNSRLRAFLDDDLPEPENVQLADHLNHCEACQRTLERLAAGSRLWAEFRQAIPASGPVRPAAHSGSEPHGTLPHGDPAAEGDTSLDFLGPPGIEDSLGRLGPYEVTSVLGRGGFGIVLKACDPALQRTVAIKILAPQLATSGVARNRFAREARAAAAVVHDNVVAIHSVEAVNGLPYLVMPFIAGQSLQQRVDRDGPLAIKEVLRIGMQAALGLAAAHGQGIVHRDVKPSNILLENGVERVKLCDFGMARAVDDASLTRSGVVRPRTCLRSRRAARVSTIAPTCSALGVSCISCARAIHPFGPIPRLQSCGGSATIRHGRCAKSMPICPFGLPKSSNDCTPRSRAGVTSRRPKSPKSCNTTWPSCNAQELRLLFVPFPRRPSGND
jgi:serine/threonine protein kinase